MARETDVKCESPSIKHARIFNFVGLLKDQHVQDGETFIFFLEESYTLIYYY
jgi:hypothetical protein